MSDRVEKDAAVWALRMPLDEQQRIACDRWLADDPRRSGALLRAMAAVTLVEDALEPVGEPIEATTATYLWRSRRWLVAGMGGAIAATVAGMIVWPRGSERQVTTAHGEIRRLPLADGSVATIDAGSDMRILLASDSRRVELDRGRAWFQVAKDRQRPFVVDAGIAQARAVGTAFSVARDGDAVRMAVTEGSIAVWASDASGMMTILEQGQYAEFRRGAASPVVGTAPGRIERSLAWRNGEIALENDTMASAVAQFNRYNRQRIVLADAALGEERLVGLFRIDRPADFAAMLRTSLGVRSIVTANEIRIFPKRKTREHDGNLIYHTRE